MNSEIKNKNKIYLGIQILRILFSFHILVFHFHCVHKKQYKLKYIRNIISKVDIDLITFFIISFYFSHDTFVFKNIIKIKFRFKRLLIPYIIWPIIIFIIRNINNYFSNNNLIRFKYLYYQLLIGNGINLVFWFQFNLMLISLIFIIVILFSQKRYHFYLCLIGFLFCIFKFCLPHYNKLIGIFNGIAIFSLKPIVSSYIYSITGFFLHDINIIKKANNHKKIYIFFSSLLFCFLLFYKKPSENNEFLFYLVYDLMSLLLFIVFLIFPFNSLINDKYEIIIKKMASYSAGIYYLHTQIISLLDYISVKIASRALLALIINYLLCNMICIIGAKIFRNNSLRYLFI